MKRNGGPGRSRLSPRRGRPELSDAPGKILLPILPLAVCTLAALNAVGVFRHTAHRVKRSAATRDTGLQSVLVIRAHVLSLQDGRHEYDQDGRGHESPRLHGSLSHCRSRIGLFDDASLRDRLNSALDELTDLQCRCPRWFHADVDSRPHRSGNRPWTSRDHSCPGSSEDSSPARSRPSPAQLRRVRLKWRASQ
jgi:hypothetical protein